MRLVSSLIWKGRTRSTEHVRSLPPRRDGSDRDVAKVASFDYLTGIVVDMTVAMRMYNGMPIVTL